MPDKYERLLEQNIKAIETSNRVADALLEVAKGSKEITNKLNDNFILHSKQADSMESQVSVTAKHIEEIRKVLMKWIKNLAILLFVTVGGLSILKLLGVDLTKLFN